jgi:hypothetical protein
VFRGSIPGDLQRITHQHVKSWNAEQVFIGCSGNLTVERVIADTHKRLNGNDILLYSSAMGSYLAGAMTDFTLSTIGAEAYPWMADSMGSDEERLATMLIASRLAQGLGKEDSNPYYGRIRDAHENQWDRMMSQTIARIQKARTQLRLESFAIQDVATWIDDVPADAGVISYPPFFAGDYESQFSKMESLFDWHDRPSFDMLTKERIYELFGKIMDRDDWMLCVNERLEWMEPHLRGIVQTSNRGVEVCVYGSSEQRRIIKPRQETAPLLVPHIKRGDKLGEKLSLMPLTSPQFSAVRSMYMNRNIKPGQATLPLGVLVDGVLVGAIAFSSSPTMANWDSYIDGPHIYLLSDFPVADTSYPRLAKLMLYAAMSKEAQVMAERSANRRCRSLTTTAFSKRPASMKYRGVFQLLKRQATEPPAAGADASEQYYAQGFALQYGATMGAWTLAEGYDIWKKKHGDDDGTLEP